ncbi:hypothetical protein DMUE_2786 [Dictyocoela muelleri]|nr:hypothetical protein DMUE_2786 [Dictyocoela muelleri]
MRILIIDVYIQGGTQVTHPFKNNNEKSMKFKTIFIITNDKELSKFFTCRKMSIDTQYFRGNISFKFTLKMVRYTDEQRAKIVELYFSCNCSIIAVQRTSGIFFLIEEVLIKIA